MYSRIDRKHDDVLFSELLPETQEPIIRGDHHNKTGITLTWTNLSVTVKETKNSILTSNTVTHKKLVNNVSGAVGKGKLVALMGPSGAGKSTILCALANRLSDEMIVDGEIQFNGEQVNKSMCRLSGLMRQEDIFIGDLTVKEHLMFMARLKLDTMDSVEREERVCQLINGLGLKHCTNQKIGGPAMGKSAKLSGGERKRLSFATACLPNPPLLFCDEPTTGLDSLNAYRIISTMASWNATILCTIHQPSSEILKCFSSVMLVSDGSIVFSGLVDDAIDFFKSAGYHMEKDKGAGEFLLNCLSSTPDLENVSRMNKKKLVHQYDISECTKPYQNLTWEEELPLEMKSSKLHSHNYSMWFYKFYCLLYRSILELNRNPNLQWIKIAEKIVIALAAGLCFVGTINKDQAGIQAIQGVIFVLVTENTFPALYSALALIPSELPLTVREIRDGDYPPSAYYLAKVLSYIPGFALNATLFTMIIYWLTSLRWTVFAFFMTNLITILCMMVSTSCGLMFANMFENYEKASVFLVPFDNSMLILSGVFVKVSTLPIVVHWLQYISWMRYCYETMTIVQWQNIDNISCSLTNYLPCLKSGNEIFEYYGFDEKNIYINIILLIMLFIIFNIISYIFFLKKIKRHC